MIARGNRLAVALIAIALIGIPLAGIAALAIRQSATVTPAAIAPDVQFEQGSGYATIAAAGFASVTASDAGASVAVSLSGIPGASYVLMTNVLGLENIDVSQAYSVTLTRSADPDPAITDLILTVKNGVTTLATWDAADTASTSFTIPAATTLDVSIQLVVAPGTALQTFAAFQIHMDLVPA